MKTLIIAEKPDIACKLGALGRNIFGEFKLSNGVVLSPTYLTKNEQVVKGMVSKAKRLENDNYVIMFAAGHLVELFQAYDYDESFKNWRNIPSGYIPPEFKMKIKSSATELFKELKKTMNSKEIKEIIVATDADREGQAIFEYIYKMANCSKPCQRIWSDAFTETGIEKAYKRMKNNQDYQGVANAGYGRMTSDFLMGALLTAKTTTKLGGGSKEIINVGRVQTAVLAEIVRVENLIKNFKKQKSYQIVGSFKTQNGERYEGVYEEKFDDLAKAQRLITQIKGNNAKVSNTSNEKVNVWCPPLFDQTSLAMELANKYSMSPDQTLASCQVLYEKGYQTYPRTASRYITDGDAEQFKKTLSELKKVNPLAGKHSFNKNNKRIVDNSKVESHTAIVPTENIPDFSKLSFNERNTYTEVMLRTIAVNFPQAVDEKQSIETSIKDIPFKSNGKIELERGFREVYKSEAPNNPLPHLNKGENVEVLDITYKEVETQPPKRYTNATILRFMETCGKNIENEEARELIKNKGIGTSATRADIIKKLVGTNYIILKGKTIYPTEKGCKMIEVFPVDELKNPEFTGNLEFQLYKVEKAEESLNNYMQLIAKVYKDACKKIDETNKSVVKGTETEGLGICPCCKQGQIMHRKGSKNGKKFDFYGCSNWQGGCKFTIGEICGKLLTEKQVTTLIEKGETSRIKGLKTKLNKELPSAKFVIKNGKVELDFN